MLAANGCELAQNEPWQPAFGANYCQIWRAGCEQSPVVNCEAPNTGHTSGGTVAVKGYWELWSQLP